MRRGFLSTITATAALFTTGARAARACAGNPTYAWRVSDARFDGAVPDASDGVATVAVSIVPTTSSYGTFFECVASWPEAWEGWYDGGSDNIIWSDCIWAGNGLTADTTVSFAMDWANRTMFITHTFECSDTTGSNGLGTGTLQLDMDCATGEDGSNGCTLGSVLNFTTTGAPAHQDPGTDCAGTSESYQSWQLEGWARKYELPPGSPSDPPRSDTGPSFTLRNMANVDVFNCSSSGNEDNTFVGTCTASGEAASASTAEFSFDRALNMLTVTQHWECDDASTLDVVGVGYVQATCGREGNVLTCTSGPIWIGTKTLG